jgi:hypothetical protein
MTLIVNIAEVRDRIAAREGYTAWVRLFGERYDVKTTIHDLSDPVLCKVTQPGEQREMLLNSLIIGFLGFGTNTNKCISL